MAVRENQLKKLESKKIITIESDIQSVDFAIQGKGFAIITQQNGIITGEYSKMKQLFEEALQVIQLYFYNEV